MIISNVYDISEFLDTNIVQHVLKRDDKQSEQNMVALFPSVTRIKKWDSPVRFITDLSQLHFPF